MIYVIAHKECDIPILDSGYTILHVGAYGKPNYGWQRDDEGENISKRNAEYCELTGLYWMWKNTADEYLGLVHYRRYFVKNMLSCNTKTIYTLKQLTEIANKYDIVIPKQEHFIKSLHEYLIINGITDTTLSLLQQVIKNIYPEYLDTYNKILSGNILSPCNMFFCNHSIMNDYCEWLFSILFELEFRRKKEIPNENSSRLYGFLSERLFNVWIERNELQVCQLPIVNLELSLHKRFFMIGKDLCGRIIFKNPC